MSKVFYDTNLTAYFLPYQMVLNVKKNIAEVEMIEFTALNTGKFLKGNVFELVEGELLEYIITEL